MGPSAKRPRRVNIHWGGVVEDNSFGTHEFLDFCEQIGAEPVHRRQRGQRHAAGDGRLDRVHDLRRRQRDRRPGAPERTQDAVEGPLPRHRQRELGMRRQMTPEYYSDLYRRFSVYARDWSGNKLTRVAAGPGGTQLKWLDVLAGRVRRGVEGISMHYYTTGSPGGRTRSPSTGFGEDQWYVIVRDALKIDSPAGRSRGDHGQARSEGQGRALRGRVGHLVHPLAGQQSGLPRTSRIRSATPSSRARPSTSSTPTPSA